MTPYQGFNAKKGGITWPVSRGPDEQVPPAEDSEGHACCARESKMDDPTLWSGRDKRVPPKRGPDEQVPPAEDSEGHASLCP
jgi:hypothetical protein